MPIQASDIVVTPGAPTTATSAFSVTPKTDGDAGLSVQVTVSGTNLCQDGLVAGLVCNLLSGLLVTSSSVSVDFPQLPTPVLTGSKLSTAAKLGHSSFDLLNPVPRTLSALDDPHYWFFRNQWYRYTYYAVAPSATPAGGANLTVNEFPSTFGSTSDKRFVLTVMGPAVTGQTRGSTAAMDQYVEGANAASSASPRVFAYQVFATAGNDRIATCPFTDIAAVCD